MRIALIFILFIIFMMPKEACAENAVSLETQVRELTQVVHELKNTVDEEYIGFLAAQIVNFLTGEAINDCYQKADDSMKLKIDKIRDRILPCAHDKMKKDYKARELIVYTLRMSEVFDFAIKKEAHLDSEQHKSRLDILSTYGAEFPIEANPELYEQIVTNYYKERYKFVENNKRRI